MGELGAPGPGAAADPSTGERWTEGPGHSPGARRSGMEPGLPRARDPPGPGRALPYPPGLQVPGPPDGASPRRGSRTPGFPFLGPTFPAGAALGLRRTPGQGARGAGCDPHPPPLPPARMGEEPRSGCARLGTKFKYYVEITKQIKSLLSGCHGLPLDNTFNEDYGPPGYSFRFAFYYQRTTYALLQDFH